MAESIYILGDEDRAKFARLIAAAWADEDVKARFDQEPRELLAEYGVVIPEGVPTPLLPARPEGEFSVEDLQVAAGAQVEGCVGTAGTLGTIGGCAGTAGTYGCA
uniref:thiocillin family RiPP n=1 Tax=Herbidospora sakaeratensis TaxID=564415 RepID=UPI0007849429|nr:thiocillin family RiPP [Herbidospora sakaeratensis]